MLKFLPEVLELCAFEAVTWPERLEALQTSGDPLNQKSDYAENKVVDWCTGKADPPTSIGARYVALYTATPSDAGGGTEVSGNNYSRKSTAAADWNAAASGSASNANAITFAVPSGSWGTVTHFGIFDAATAGNLIRWAALGASKTIGNGDTPSFAAGTLVVTED
jgi:hypothetical protein